MKALFALLLIACSLLAFASSTSLNAGVVSPGLSQAGAVVPTSWGALLVPPSDVGTVISGPDGTSIIANSHLLG